jgi:hypothetical protein
MSTTTEATRVVVTLAQFDTQDPFEIITDAQPLSEVRALTHNDYEPRGGTPLLDATRTFIDHLDEQDSEGHVRVGLLLDRSGSMAPNREAVIDGVNEFVGGLNVDTIDPAARGKVLAVIVTDGLENSSRRISKEELARVIAEREARGWTFIYLGANQDAWSEASRLGYSGGASGQSVTYTATPSGTRAAMRTTTSKAAAYLASQADFLADGKHNTIVSEDGAEVDRGTGQMPQSPTAPATPSTQPQQPRRRGTAGYDVGGALRQAQHATSTPDDKRSS